jgi:hypothetical protein
MNKIKRCRCSHKRVMGFAGLPQAGKGKFLAGNEKKPLWKPGDSPHRDYSTV